MRTKYGNFCIFPTKSAFVGGRYKRPVIADIKGLSCSWGHGQENCLATREDRR